ncbi:hypothetical protein NDU88_004323 [Pleurodeles waltl]|uniref:Reverse transcriptase domain-containing protein n=1 Tax=Pleurodeles waltl TaxID=8319 RepID=A0AAV7TTV9_PLEWA|nr:hypothetical protein NDU88_004323 [Pleurodeles waltl]
MDDLPQDLRQVMIVLIHKNWEAYGQGVSYSLATPEICKLAKVLANRLLLVTDGIVALDQSEFMLHRSTRHSTCRHFGCLARLLHVQEPVLLLVLDNEKAFESLEWSYLMTLQECMGLAPLFLARVSLFCHELMARVHPNGTLSQEFELRRGTRQVCFISALLLVVEMEPLVNKAWRYAVMQDLHWDGDWEDVVSLYADDFLLYLADPGQSLQSILEILGDLWALPWHNDQLRKSIAYSLSQWMPQGGWPVALVRDSIGFTYLGIYMTMDCKLFYNKNVGRIQRNFFTDFRQLLISLIGRAALYKLIYLSKFLYVLQSS